MIGDRPHRLRADVAALLERAAVAPAFDAGAFDPIAARAVLRATIAEADEPRPASVAVSDFAIPGPGGDLHLRLYRPDPLTDGAVVLFCHGGGWIMGDLDTHDGLCGAIAQALGMRVVAVDYRLAPEHRFPAALDDAEAAVLWVASAPAMLGEEVDGLILAGDSAGGNLVASCAVRGVGDALALWTMYASFDMNATGGSMDDYAEGYLLTAGLLALFRRYYFADAIDRNSPRASPLLADDVSRVPPALIFANECDPLRDQSRTFAARLAAAGCAVRYREAVGHIHGSLLRRRAVPSGQGELAGCLVDLKALVVEARARQEWAA